MQIIQVVGVGLIGAVLAVLLKRDKPEMQLLVVVATGAIILVLVLSAMTQVIASFADLVALSGLHSDLFAGVLKIVGVGYLVEYAASMCTDMGQSSIAGKVQLAGKITIFLMGLPIVKALVQTIAQLLQV